MSMLSLNDLGWHIVCQCRTEGISNSQGSLPMAHPVTHSVRIITDCALSPVLHSANASPCPLHEFPGAFLLTHQLPGAIQVEGCVPEKTRLGLAHQHLQRLVFSAVLRPRNRAWACPHFLPPQGLQIEASFLVPRYIDALNFYFKNTFPDSYKMGIKLQVPILKYI